MSDKVKEAFEAWANTESMLQPMDKVFEAGFKAGRESMRAEAMEACCKVKEWMGGDDNLACQDCEYEIKELP